MAADSVTNPVSPGLYRQVLGQFPTGVVVVTAAPEGRAPVALTIGSFSSVSLDPPLVAFFPDNRSSSWPVIRDHGRFCVNVLGANQEALCRTFAQKGDDKFAGVSWRPGPSGSPILDGVVAWIDCTIEEVQDQGDHQLVIGRVHAMDVEKADLPLLFFRGGYGRFSPSSLVASDMTLAKYLPMVDVVRPELESVGIDCDGECLLSARVLDEYVVLAGAGVRSQPSNSGPTRVGRRMPYTAPFGTVIAAHSDEAEISRWLSWSGDVDDAEFVQWRTALDVIRERGYAVGVGNAAYAAMDKAVNKWAEHRVEGFRAALHDVRQQLLRQDAILDEPTVEVRSISVPVFLPDGGSVVNLGLYGLPPSMTAQELRSKSDRMVEAGRRCTAALASHVWH